ncbi:unnamed protein product, partial [Ectocarpus fasciculatus]
YLVELARSGRAECKRCSSIIANKELRVGVIVEGDWGIMTRWQHLKCTVFHKSITKATELDGYTELDPEDKAIVRKRVKDSLNEIDEDDIPVDPNELIRTGWTEAVDAPPDLVLPLLPYQREGLGWMVNQENNGVHGGILADEMGMGKTIQAISLILANKPDRQSTTQLKVWKQSDARHNFKGITAMSRGNTLIVVPTVALRQWQSEIVRFSREGSLKVLVYHGDNRESDSKRLREADVVLTTYKIIEIEHRKATAGTKIVCSICKKKFYPEKLRIHRKYFCGEDAERTDAQARTESKGRRRRLSAVVPDRISESESSDEDDIAAQKKRNRKAAAKHVNSTSAAPITKAVSNRNSRKAEQFLPESSEDDITKQKKANKVAARKAGKAVAVAAPEDTGRSKGKRKPPGDIREDVSDESLSGDSYSRGNDSSSDSVSNDSDSNSDSIVDVPTKRRKAVEAKPKSSGKKAQGNPDNIKNKKTNTAVEEEIRVALLKHARENRNIAPKTSILHEISWFRIILDEAHLIKDRSTSTAHACFALTSLNKWCLTGTPLQNRVGELYSLVRFLRLDPHAFYYCRSKGCECKSLHYRFTQGRCDGCNHTAMQHFCHFNKHILNPIKRSGYVSEGRRAMMKLKDQILDAILLRRTKADRSDDIMLPARYIAVRQEPMDEREADFYEALYTQSKAQFNTYVRSGTVLNNYAHIFDILIRLRQAVDHPYLVIYSDTIKERYGSQQGKASSNELVTCALCHEPPEDPRKAKCGHTFCRQCALELVDAAADVGCRCPKCDKPLTISSIGEDDVVDSTTAIEFKSRKASIISKINLDKFQSSSKLEALVQELHNMSRNDPGAKAIVFSQFVNMLDLIAFRLHLEGMACDKLLGYMTVEHRDQALRSFNEDPNVKVLLISLKTGGVALNLTVANYIFLMDPWWNPAAEMQAIDRAHRIGQNKPIFATRFIVKDSIEERILKLQEKKQLVFDGTVGGDATSMARLTVDDMRFLFQ